MEIRQRGDAGRRYPIERRTYVDSATGATVERLTESRSHDHHLYYTTSGLYDDGRRLLFASDRTGEPNLFSVDLESGVLTQLTDLPEPTGQRGFRGFQFPLQYASVETTRGEAYFWYDRALVALDLEDLTLRTLYERPEGYLGNVVRPSADGEHLFTVVFEDLRDEIAPDVGWTPWQRKGAGMRQYWQLFPDSRVLRIPVDSPADAEVIHQEEYWLAHVNPSPTQPAVATFCHYGPYRDVDHRIWGVDADTGEVWKIRRTASDGTPSPPAVHEFWLADGERIGYYGYDGDGSGMPVFGIIRYDDDESRIETPVSTGAGNAFPHFHANETSLVVGDSSRDLPWLFAWTVDDETGAFDAPRALCRHDCSFHVQIHHAHPRVTPGDGSVVYTSDRSGYSNVYRVEVPPFAELPPASDVVEGLD